MRGLFQKGFLYEVLSQSNDPWSNLEAWALKLQSRLDLSYTVGKNCCHLLQFLQSALLWRLVHDQYAHMTISASSFARKSFSIRSDVDFTQSLPQASQAIHLVCILGVDYTGTISSLSVQAHSLLSTLWKLKRLLFSYWFSLSLSSIKR